MSHPSKNSEFSIALRAASRSLGIQTSYQNNEGQIVWAPARTLAQLCKDLSGHFPTTTEDALLILKEKHKHLVEKILPTSLVAWGGSLKKFHVQLRYERDIRHLSFKINDEPVDFKILTRLNRKDRITLQIQISSPVPIGYSELVLFKSNLKYASSFIISAPEKLSQTHARQWGPFIPLYALRSENDWGIGSFSDLANASRICKKFGAGFVSVLPTLAGHFENEDCDPSPYSALTRFFWNEIYLDVDQLLRKYPVTEALKLRKSPAFNEALNELRNSEYVNYHKCYQLKKKILKILAADFFSKPLPDSYTTFLKNNPLAEDYAHFRSSEQSTIQYHLFAQFETDQVLSELHRNLGLTLYMDYPVGVNDAGFDFKKDPQNFLGSVSVGAPPEAVFQLGQDWGFPAFHPQNLPLKNYSYFIDSIRQHLKFSKILRLDHVIGLYRIYSVPKGFGGKNGAYIRFAEEDFFAIVVLEAERAGADIIGENLGTVPPQVNEILNQRNLKRMQILQLDLGLTPAELTPKLDQNTLCAINTHDMPMFARFLKGEDLDEVRDLGILSPDFYPVMKNERQLQLERWKKIFHQNPVIGALQFLADSDSRYLVVNIEDLWGEEHPQNIPGTWKEVPNWRRKMLLPIEKWESNESCKRAFTLLRERFSVPKKPLKV